LASLACVVIISDIWSVLAGGTEPITIGGIGVVDDIGACVGDGVGAGGAGVGAGVGHVPPG
jgi:hypothetical protein